MSKFTLPLSVYKPPVDVRLQFTMARAACDSHLGESDLRVSSLRTSDVRPGFRGSVTRAAATVLSRSPRRLQTSAAACAHGDGSSGSRAVSTDLGARLGQTASEVNDSITTRLHSLEQNLPTFCNTRYYFYRMESNDPFCICTQAAV